MYSLLEVFTKPSTSLLVMVTVESGTLNFNDSLTKFVIILPNDGSQNLFEYGLFLRDQAERYFNEPAKSPAKLHHVSPPPAPDGRSSNS